MSERTYSTLLSEIISVASNTLRGKRMPRTKKPVPLLALQDILPLLMRGNTLVFSDTSIRCHGLEVSRSLFQDMCKQSLVHMNANMLDPQPWEFMLTAKGRDLARGFTSV